MPKLFFWIYYYFVNFLKEMEDKKP